jgi:signal transduction histidine kinase
MLIRRTAKILAMSRAILATVFLAAVWLEPSQAPKALGLAQAPQALGLAQTPQALGPGSAVLALYLGWSGLMAVISWRSWWWDFRFARVAHAIDITVLITAVFLTETGNSDFSSPFIAFTAFLLIKATLRWGRDGVVSTALVLVIGYGIAGLVMVRFGPAIDSYAFGRRLTYMIALSLMMVWLGADERVARLAPMPETGGIPGKRRQQVLAGALSFARHTFHARGAAIAVIGSEEPWVDLYRDVDGVFMHERIGPEVCPDDLAPEIDAALFDIARRRRIVSFSDHHLEPVCGPFALALADTCQVSDGLIGRIASASGHGQLLVWGVPDAGIDDLPAIGSLAREIGLALDREEMALLAQSIAVARVRNALARDLHDSVAQFLAGTLFRLEALRRWIREGRDPDAEILAMREALRNEQAELRTLIDRLRRGIEGDRAIDIAAELETLMAEMGDHWHIATSLSTDCRPLPVSIGMAHELRQLVREAVANAVRHGHCNRVELTLERTKEGLLQVSIGDNGKGFPATNRTLRPRSISERIDALGGQLRIASCADGVRLDIELPLPIAA